MFININRPKDNLFIGYSSESYSCKGNFTETLLKFECRYSKQIKKGQVFNFRLKAHVTLLSEKDM